MWGKKHNPKELTTFSSVSFCVPVTQGQGILPVRGQAHDKPDTYVVLSTNNECTKNENKISSQTFYYVKIGEDTKLSRGSWYGKAMAMAHL